MYVRLSGTFLYTNSALLHTVLPYAFSDTRDFINLPWARSFQIQIATHKPLDAQLYYTYSQRHDVSDFNNNPVRAHRDHYSVSVVVFPPSRTIYLSDSHSI